MDGVGMDGFGVGFFIFVGIMIVVANIMKYRNNPSKSPEDDQDESLIDPATGQPRAFGPNASSGMDVTDHNDPFN